MSFVPRQTDRYCSVLTSRDFVQACWAEAVLDQIKETGTLSRLPAQQENQHSLGDVRASKVRAMLAMLPSASELTSPPGRKRASRSQIRLLF